MAHALKYFKEITMADGRTVRLELWRDGWTGSAMEIGPVTQTLKLDIQGTNNEIDSPIVKTSLTMAFADAPDHPDAETKKCGDWEEFYTPSSTAWKVILKANDVGESFRAIWGGYVTPDSFSETLQYRGTVTITARDNIGHMQDFMFDAPGDADGMISLYDLITYAWAKIESPMSLDMRGEEDELKWLECDGVYALDTLMNVSAFEGKNWYEVLESALYSYGLVMRYVGGSRVMIASLRSLPTYGRVDVDSVSHETPTFLAHADRELAPAVRRIEENVSYTFEDKMQAPLGNSLDFSGYIEQVVFEGSTASGQPVQIDGAVHPVENTSETGWGNVKDKTLFCAPHLYHIDDRLSSYRNSVWLAGYTAGENEVWYGSYFNSGSLRIEMIFGPPARIIRSTDFEQYGNQYDRAKTVTVAITKDKNGIREYWNGEQWQAAEIKLTLEIDKAERKAFADISFEESGRTLIQVHFYDFELVNRFVPSSGAPGIYISLASMAFMAQEATAMLENNRVITVYDDTNNVIISRDPDFGPAMDTPISPSIISNGIFYRNGVNIYPARAWSWPGGTPQQMAVYNHLQLLCYHSKPNNVLSGTIVNTNLTRVATIWTWGGAEHLLISGSLDFLHDRIDGAVLREFARYESMWADLPGTVLPEVQEQSRTNVENGSTGGSQTPTYTNTTTVNISGSGGTSDHEQLENRDLPDQHPMTAITGLLQALEQAGLLELTPDGLAVTPKNGLGIVTPSFISAQSADPLADNVGMGGLDIEQLWFELADQDADKASEKQINASHLVDFQSSLNLSQYLTAQSLNGYATETYVNNRIASFVDSAPEALNTLNELAAALGDDPNFATTVMTQIGNKVDKVAGKGLSTNDFTDTNLADVERISYLMTDFWLINEVAAQAVTRTADNMSLPLLVTAMDISEDYENQGTSWTLPAATTSLAGLMSASDKVIVNDAVRRSLTTEQVMSGSLKLVNLTATGSISSQSANAQADVIGAGGMDTDAMWLELRTESDPVDANKVIHMSHLPRVVTGFNPASGQVAGASSLELEFEVKYNIYDYEYSTLILNAATASAIGLMTAVDKVKLDGIAAGANKYTLPTASTSALGGIKVGYTASGKNYKVQVDSSGNAYVNVPWTDTVYSLPLAASGTRGGIKIGFSASGANVPLQLSSEKAYVTLTNSAIIAALSSGAIANAKLANSSMSLLGKNVSLGGSLSVAEAQSALGLGEAAYKNVKNRTSHTHLGWTDVTADGNLLVTSNTIAYWDGRYDANSSNLLYYAGGAFGTMAKENAADYLTKTDAASTYLPLSGGTLLSSAARVLNLNSTASNASVLHILWNGVDKIQIGVDATSPYIYNCPSSRYLRFLTDDLTYGKDTLIHSGNIGSQSVAKADTVVLNNNDTANNDYRMLWSDGNKVYYTTGFTFNPSTKTITASLNGNAASATKLQTPRSIWGRSFDGTGNVDGSLRSMTPGIADIPDQVKVQSLVVYSPSPFGLITRINGTGLCSLQSQRESDDSETFDLALQPLGGNVLIGTTTDDGHKLQVNGSVNLMGVTDTNSIRLTGDYFFLRKNSSSPGVYFGTQSDGSLSISGHNNFSHTKSLLYLNYPNNRLGIGTTSPGAKLDVIGEVFLNTSLRVYDSTSRAYRLMLNGGSVAHIFNIAQAGETAYQDLNIGNNGITGLYFDASAGRWAIGKSTPEYTFDVVGSIKASGDIIASGAISAQGANAAADMMATGGDYLPLTGGTIDGNLTVTGQTTLGDVDLDGGLGIVGSLYMEGDLTIDGVSTFMNSIRVRGDLSVDGSVSAYEFLTSSDLRLKDIHYSYNVDFGKLKAIPKVFFTWKNGDTQTMQFGTIAQEVEKVMPEVVRTNSKGHLSVNYDRFGLIALAAIDVLHTTQETQDEKIKRLEKRVKELESWKETRLRMQS